MIQTNSHPQQPLVLLGKEGVISLLKERNHLKVEGKLVRVYEDGVPVLDFACQNKESAIEAINTIATHWARENSLVSITFLQ